MAGPTKQQMSSEINEVFGLKIDWTKLSVGDLQQVYVLAGALNDTVMDMSVDQMERIFKGKIADAVMNPGENTIRGMIRKRLEGGPLLGKLRGGEGQADGTGRSGTPILDAVRERVADEIRNADFGPGVIKGAIKDKVKQQIEQD